VFINSFESGVAIYVIVDGGRIVGARVSEGVDTAKVDVGVETIVGLAHAVRRNKTRGRIFFIDYLFASQPMVCVTGAGAGGGTPSDWKNEKA
jgi:hypothetical protein